MLNYKDLNNKLDAFLAKQTKEGMEAWLEMDRERMSFYFKNKVPQTFINKDCGIFRPQTNENLQNFKQVFLFLYNRKIALNAHA